MNIRFVRRCQFVRKGASYRVFGTPNCVFLLLTRGRSGGNLGGRDCKGTFCLNNYFFKSLKSYQGLGS